MSNALIDRSTFARFGPWACPSCNADSQVPYRCSACGHPFEGDKKTAGREARQ